MLQRGLINRGAEPQLIAAAIGAYHKNEYHRRVVGLPPPESQTFLGVIMRGTAPSFYKITIPKELWLAVMTGRYPQQTTVVRKVTSPFPDVRVALGREGMVSLENRRVTLKCFEGLKKILVCLSLQLLLLPVLICTTEGRDFT